jgi:hypothetical protein
MALYLWLAAASALSLLLMAGFIHLVVRSGSAGRALAEAMSRAPLLDLLVGWFTVMPPLVGFFVGATVGGNGMWWNSFIHTDELLSIGTLRGSVFDITVQDSLLAWGLDRANHPKGKHSKGALICSMDSDGDCGRITLLRNLFAHNRDRNPDVKGTSIGPVEIVNNVFYDPKSQFGEFYDIDGDLRVNYIGNTVISGPSTRRTRVPYAVEIHNDYSSTFDAMVYVRGNVDGAHRSGESEPDELVVRPGDRLWLAPAPFAPLTVEALDAEAARAFVLANAGATRPARDSLDRRAIDDVINRSGRVVNDAEEAGGWPRLSSGPVPADADADGMPGEWEIAHGADPRAFDAWLDADGDGWTNLEDFLNERAGGTVATTQ